MFEFYLGSFKSLDANNQKLKAGKDQKQRAAMDAVDVKNEDDSAQFIIKREKFIDTIVIPDDDSPINVRNARNYYKSWGFVYRGRWYRVTIFNKKYYELGVIDTKNNNWLKELSEKEKFFGSATDIHSQRRHLRNAKTLYVVYKNEGKAPYKQHRHLAKKIDDLYQILEDDPDQGTVMEAKKLLLILYRMLQHHHSRGMVHEEPKPWKYDPDIFAKDLMK